MRDYSAIIWAKQEEAMASTSDFMSPDEFLIAMGTSIVLRSWLDGRVHLKLGLMGSVA